MFGTIGERISDIIRSGAKSAMTEREFFQREINKWITSPDRQNQITGDKYYRGKHDILERKRTAIGMDGRLSEIRNLPNNKIIDNQYAKMVDQKTDYLLGKPFTVQSDNDQHTEALKLIFNRRFHRLIQNVGEDCLNCGIAWLYVYYDEAGELSFKRFAPYEILPFWKDSEHTVLDCVVRVYEVEAYEGREPRIIEKVEVYKSTGIERYTLEGGVLVEDVETPSSAYFSAKDPDGTVREYNWERLPIIPFKYNSKEIPLICKVKSLQDALNNALSDFQNNMQEDSRSTIMVLKNYDGEDLSDFRRNLMEFGAIKVRTFEGEPGGVEAIHIDVNSDNYRALLELLKEALIENAMGYDAKDERMSGTPNQMNIQSMYSDIDLDANGMETEYQAAFEDLLFFINAHLANTGVGQFAGEDVRIIFNRDMMMNEADIVGNIRNSVGILSTETLISQHPWVDDVETELKRLRKEEQAAYDVYADSFPGHSHDDAIDGDEE